VTGEKKDNGLLDLKAARGEWAVASEHATDAEALAAVDEWREHCDATNWRAFEFVAVDREVWGRFVGTKFVPVSQRKVGSP